MILESGRTKVISRPEGIYTYNKWKEEYTFKSKEDVKNKIPGTSEIISEYRFRKAIREEREEWKSSTEDF